MEQISAVHDGWLDEPTWIIDGWGGMENIWGRFKCADQIIFVDFPLCVHYWWAFKRHFKAVLGLNPDWPPPGCRAWLATRELVRVMRSVDREMRPQILEMLEVFRADKQVVDLKSPGEIRGFAIQVETQKSFQKL